MSVVPASHQADLLAVSATAPNLWQSAVFESSSSPPRVQLNIGFAFIASIVDLRRGGEDEILPILARIPRLGGNLLSGYLTENAQLPPDVCGAYRNRARVVVDSPPMCEVRPGHTRRERLERLRELFDRRTISPPGFVVTTHQRPDFAKSEYSYGGPVPDARVRRLKRAITR